MDTNPQSTTQETHATPATAEIAAEIGPFASDRRSCAADRSDLELSQSPSPKEHHTIPSDKLPALLSVPRAAKLLGLNRASAYRYAASGELPIQRFGGRVYVITARIRHLLGDDVEVAA